MTESTADTENLTKALKTPGSCLSAHVPLYMFVIDFAYIYAHTSYPMYLLCICLHARRPLCTQIMDLCLHTLPLIRI